MKANEVIAMVAFAKVGMSILASRIVSVCALVGVVGLSSYVIYNPSWQGVAVVALAAFCGLLPAIRSEGARGMQEETIQQ